MAYTRVTEARSSATKVADQDDVVSGAAAWRWPISYRSLEGLGCIVDAALITVFTILVGSGYSVFVLTIEPDVGHFLALGMIISLIFVVSMRGMGLYKPASILASQSQAKIVALVWIGSFLFLSGVFFSLKIGSTISRGTIILLGITGLAAIITHRALFASFVRAAVKHGRFRQRKVILMREESLRGGADLASELSQVGFSIEKQYSYSPRASDAEEIFKEASRFARGSDVEEIFVMADLSQWAQSVALVSLFRTLPLPVTLVPDATSAALLRLTSYQLSDSIALEYQRPPLTVSERVAKRSFDLVLSTAGVILLAPLLVVVACAVKLDSPGSIFFQQRRQGFNGKQFTIIKFRTMICQEDGEVVTQARPFDARVTRLGAWLRRTSIDELPQLFNVLRGEMSLVGPRPHAVAHDNQFEMQIANYAFRHHTKPGITGFAQVNGLRGETPTVHLMEMRVEFDIWYINNYSLWLDLTITLRTCIQIFWIKNVY